MDITNSYSAVRSSIDSMPNYQYAGWGYLTATQKDGGLIVYSEKGAYSLKGNVMSCFTAKDSNAWDKAQEMIGVISEREASASQEAKEKIAQAKQSCRGLENVQWAAKAAAKTPQKSNGKGATK
jgi:hypothetical protein